MNRPSITTNGHNSDYSLTEISQTSPGHSSENLGTAENRIPSQGTQRLAGRSGLLSGPKATVLIGCAVLQLPIWGFAMTYGLFQEYFTDHWEFSGSQDAAGVVGTTFNGVMYLSMPILFVIFNRRWARYRKLAAFMGTALACLSFVLSSFCTAAWQLVFSLGVVAALGNALVYSPTTLALSEFFSQDNRALAYGIVLSAKNITGTACPFLVEYLLQHYGFRTTMRIWTGFVAGTSLLTLFLLPFHPPGMLNSVAYRARRTPWHFTHHATVYLYSVAILFQSSGYGIAQTYLNTYAQSVAALSAASSTLLLTLFNAPGILSSYFFGLLSDNSRLPLSATATTFISAICAAFAAFFLWGFAGTGPHSMALLVLFSIIYGFFAGGYSATWGGVIKQMEREAADRNEAIDTGMVYGLLNGARGIGYVGGGLVGVQLLKAGATAMMGKLGSGTAYGPLILYTGLSTAVGGWTVAFRGKRLLQWLKSRTQDRGL